MEVAEVDLRDHPRSLFFCCPNKGTKWRAQTIYEKEPITIEWLDRLKPEDVLWDIGANVGVYTIYAGVKIGCKVFAFEPESQNYGILNVNIRVNHLDDTVFAYCVALGNSLEMDVLNLSKFEVGGSCHTYGEEKSWSGKDLKPDYKQGCIQMPAAILMEWLEPPTHVKIDVDGHEPQVVEGLLNQASSSIPKSLIIETNWNLPAHRKMVDFLESCGYKWSQEQADASKRPEGSAFANVGETIFDRP